MRDRNSLDKQNAHYSSFDLMSSRTLTLIKVLLVLFRDLLLSRVHPQICDASVYNVIKGTKSKGFPMMPSVVCHTSIFRIRTDLFDVVLCLKVTGRNVNKTLLSIFLFLLQFSFLSTKLAHSQLL